MSDYWISITEIGLLKAYEMNPRNMKNNHSNPSRPYRKSFSPKKKPESLIFGVHPVEEAIAASKQIDRIMMLKGQQAPAIKEIVKQATAKNIPISYVPVQKLNQLVSGAHQGIVAWLASISYQPMDEVVAGVYDVGGEPSILMLDGVTDVRNFGAIARTAECAHVDAIVVPAKGAAPVGPDAVKTSAGALHHIPVCREPSLETAVQYLQDFGLQVVACTEKASDSIYEVDFSRPSAIVMGAEDTGVSEAILRKADVLAKIPLHGQINSLNVSVATGIVLFEALRQKEAAKEGQGE